MITFENQFFADEISFGYTNLKLSLFKQYR